VLQEVISEVCLIWDFVMLELFSRALTKGDWCELWLMHEGGCGAKFEHSGNLDSESLSYYWAELDPWI
jgi:hypothetical protein